jgi:cobyrinic acid a,c-diamide synthase
MIKQYPRLVIAGTNSGVGKSIISTGIMQVLTQLGYSVQGFKVGPDYIDPSYHTYATGRPSRNLDTYLLGKQGIKEIYLRQSGATDIAIIEGVMGLFDGKDGRGEMGSTAEVAKTLQAPVILVVDCRSMARSAAAVVKGFAQFDPQLNLKGVILNQIGSDNHEDLLRDAMADLGIPVVGAIRKGSLPSLTSRHLGLVPAKEKGVDQEAFRLLTETLKESIDFELLLNISSEAGKLDLEGFSPHIFVEETKNSFPGLRIGYAWDEAFSFYYQDSLEYLEHLGAVLIPFSPLYDQKLPEDLDGLIIGGGFPELYAQILSDNKSIHQEIYNFSRQGKPIYCEGGGMMYLTESIRDFEGNVFPQVGLIPARSIMHKKRQALGYYQGKTLKPSILGPRGTSIKGHEFHYSTLEAIEDFPLGVSLTKGRGKDKIEGYLEKKIYASYLHQHWAGERQMAQGFLHSCLNGKKKTLDIRKA